MSWNYRVLRYDDGTLGIHEVYYDGADPDQATGCTEDPVGAGGDDLEDVRADLEAMLRALEAPILIYEDLAKREPDRTPITENREPS